jgi:hypothetical protein
LNLESSFLCSPSSYLSQHLTSDVMSWPGNRTAPVAFTTGVADAGDHYIVASGEADLACRITHIPKALFA